MRGVSAGAGETCLPLEIQQLIDAPVLVVWDQLTRIRQWPRWGPSVVDVQCEDECIRLGSSGRVKTVLGIWLPFEVTDLEPGHSWHWRVGGLPATGHRVEPCAPGQCRLVFQIPWWMAPYGLVCREACRRLAQICAADDSCEPR